MNTSRQNHGHAGRRIAVKQQRAAKVQEQNALQQMLADLDPEYVAKLRYDCLRAANARLPGADAQAVVADAAKDFEARLRFLTERR